VARVIVGFEPIEQSQRCRIESEWLCLFHKSVTTLRIIVWPGRFYLVAPTFDFIQGLWLATLIEPFCHLLITGAVLDLRFEVVAFYPFEAEEHVIERTIKMIFTDITRYKRAAFVDRATQDRITPNPDPWTPRCFLGQILSDNIFVHSSG